MIEWVLALLGIRRAAVAAPRRPGQVRAMTSLGELVIIATPPGMLVECAELGTALAVWGIMAADHARIRETIEEGRN